MKQGLSSTSFDNPFSRRPRITPASEQTALSSNRERREKRKTERSGFISARSFLQLGPASTPPLAPEAGGGEMGVPACPHSTPRFLKWDPESNDGYPQESTDGTLLLDTGSLPELGPTYGVLAAGGCRVRGCAGKLVCGRTAGESGPFPEAWSISLVFFDGEFSGVADG